MVNQQSNAFQSGRRGKTAGTLPKLEFILIEPKGSIRQLIKHSTNVFESQAHTKTDLDDGKKSAACLLYMLTLQGNRPGSSALAISKDQRRPAAIKRPISITSNRLLLLAPLRKHRPASRDGPAGQMEGLRALRGEEESPVLHQPNVFQWWKKLLGVKGVDQRTDGLDKSTRKKSRPGNRVFNF